MAPDSRLPDTLDRFRFQALYNRDNMPPETDPPAIRVYSRSISFVARPASAEGSSSDRNGADTLEDLTPAETVLVAQQYPVLAQHDCLGARFLRQRDDGRHASGGELTH